MGNNCVGFTTSKDDAFLLPTSFWWSLLPWRETENSTLPLSHQDTNASSEPPIQQKPPMVVQMNSFQHNKSQKQETFSKESDCRREVELVVRVRPTEPEKLKVIPNIKSAGLRAESVLLAQNGYFKQYYKLGAQLGKGQFGIASLCLEKATGNKYACKSVAKVKLVKDEDLEDVRREIQIMHHLVECPNVISIKGAYEDPVAVHIVMDLCEGGDLFDRVVERGNFTETKAAELARTIISVVEACHSRGVMHRDLKPENFLFVDKHEDSTLKAIGFGKSVFFKPGEKFTDAVGTPHYIAPEVLRKCYGPEADVWSAGVIIYILLCGWPPFCAKSEEELFEEVLHGELDFSSDPWPSISESAKDLVRKMLVRYPRKRITAHEALSHPWIQVDGGSPNKPLDSAVLSGLNQFSAMNKLKKRL